jgi:hypothetical protein
MEQRCCFEIFRYVSQYVLIDADTSTVRLENLSSISKSVQGLRDSMRCDVIDGLKHDVQQSEHLYVDEADWCSHSFLAFVSSLLTKFILRLRTQKVLRDEWLLWGVLDRWSYTGIKLPDVWNEISAGREDQDAETTITTDSHRLDGKFQKSLQYLVKFSPQVQPTEGPQPPSVEIESSLKERFTPAFDPLGLPERRRHMFKDKRRGVISRASNAKSMVKQVRLRVTKEMSQQAGPRATEEMPQQAEPRVTEEMSQQAGLRVTEEMPQQPKRRLAIDEYFRQIVAQSEKYNAKGSIGKLLSGMLFVLER